MSGHPRRQRPSQAATAHRPRRPSKSRQKAPKETDLRKASRESFKALPVLAERGVPARSPTAGVEKRPSGARSWRTVAAPSAAIPAETQRLVRRTLPPPLCPQGLLCQRLHPPHPRSILAQRSSQLERRRKTENTKNCVGLPGHYGSFCPLEPGSALQPRVHYAKVPEDTHKSVNVEMHCSRASQTLRRLGLRTCVRKKVLVRLKKLFPRHTPRAVVPPYAGATAAGFTAGVSGVVPLVVPVAPVSVRAVTASIAPP